MYIYNLSIFTVDVITIWPGERVDFIVNADQPVGNYWIRYKGRGQCDPSNTTAGIFQVAILRYLGAPIMDPISPTGYNIPQMNRNTRVIIFCIISFFKYHLLFTRIHARYAQMHIFIFPFQKKKR